MTAKNSHRQLVEGRGHRYDPEVIDRLEAHLTVDDSDQIDEIKISARHLLEGMLLTRDVLHPEGFLLLSKSTLLDRRLIDQLATVERDSGHTIDAYVLRQRIGH